MTLTAADVDQAYKPTREKVRVCFDSDLVLDIERDEELLEQAIEDDRRLNRNPEAPEIAERIVAKRERAKAAEIEFAFRGIGRGPYRALIEKHPPTEAQIEAAPEGRKPRWNDATFAPALLAAACESPAGTDEAWWARKWSEWEDGRLAFIWAACVAAQEGYTEIPKAERAYALTQTFDSKPE